MFNNVLYVASLSSDMMVDMFRTADAMRDAATACRHRTADWKRLVPEGAVMATLFFEPSTRTRLSFESAMHRLGGNVISACGEDALSCAKGESLADTIQAVSNYADVLVVRSSQPTSEWFKGGDSHYCRSFVINAGDGENHHPTQALLDAYTIWRHNGCTGKAIPAGRTFGIVGDLDKSRTIRSFVEMFKREQSNQFILYDSTGRQAKFRAGTRYDDIWHVSSLEEFEAQMPKMDYLYLNRVQKERHASSTALDSTFVLTEKHLGSLKSRCLILNPGPRRDELPAHLDNWGAVRMWEQVENGLYVRMALLRKILG